MYPSPLSPLSLSLLLLHLLLDLPLCWSTYLSVPLPSITFFSLTPFLFVIIQPTIAQCALLFSSLGATQLYSPIHSAYSPPCTASRRRVLPRLASPRLLPVTRLADPRLAASRVSRERSLIFRFVHEAARRGGYHTPRERTWTRSTKRSPDGAEQRASLLPFLLRAEPKKRPVSTRLSCRHDTRSIRTPRDRPPFVGVATLEDLPTPNTGYYHGW